MESLMFVCVVIRETKVKLRIKEEKKRGCQSFEGGKVTFHILLEFTKHQIMRTI